MKRKKSRINLLWRLTEGQRSKFLRALVFLFMADIAALIGPQVIRLFIDSVVGGQEPNFPAVLMTWLNGADGLSMLRNNLWLAAVGIAGAGLMYILFDYLAFTTVCEVGESVAKNTREKVYSHLIRLPYDYFVKTPSGDILQRCSADIGEIQSLLSQDLITVIGAAITLTVNLAMMLAIDPFMTMVSVALVPAMIILTTITKGVMAKAFKKRKKCGDDLAGFMHSYVQGIRVIKAFSRQPYENSRFQKYNQDMGDSVRGTEMASAYYWPFYLTLLLSQTALVIIVGIFRVADGLTTVGTMVAFITYSTTLINRLSSFGYILISIATAQVALQRLDDIWGEEQEQADGRVLEMPLKGDIRFENVSFSYGDRQILNDVSFHVKPGETVGILGKAGSGKSTLAQLLIRLYDPVSGHIYVDGQDITGISRYFMRENVGMVLQEAFLFSRTVEENITMVAQGASDQEVHHAAAMASVDKTVHEFKDGYETVIGEKGVTVSGGQRQRIALAQTLIRKCPVLVLDDSLSAVDADTDRRIRSALKEESGNKTVILISHRIASLASCDRILVLENGSITANGTHEELSAVDGLYRRIVKIQAADGMKAGVQGNTEEGFGDIPELRKGGAR